MGDRTNKLQGLLVVYDQVNSLKAVVEFDKGSGGFFGLGKKRSDILRGEIYTVKEAINMPKYKNHKEVYDKNYKMKDKLRSICKVEGSWLS